jgi:hypothetical protein
LIAATMSWLMLWHHYSAADGKARELGGLWRSWRATSNVASGPAPGDGMTAIAAERYRCVAAAVTPTVVLAPRAFISLGSSHPRMGSSLLLSPLLSGKSGAFNGSNVHHGGENLNAESKNRLPRTPNVKVVCDTSPDATTRAAQRVSLIGGTKALDAQAG